MSKLKDGEHTLKIVVTVGEEVSKYIQTQKFYLKKYNTQMYWDEPDYTETKANEITIKGWVMSELADKEIIVKFDDEKIDNIIVASKKKLKKKSRWLSGKEQIQRKTAQKEKRRNRKLGEKRLH